MAAALAKRRVISEGAGSEVFVSNAGAAAAVSSSAFIPVEDKKKKKKAVKKRDMHLVAAEITSVAKSVWQGSMFWKIPFNSKSVARKRWFQVMRLESSGDPMLTWSNPSKTKVCVKHPYKSNYYYLFLVCIINTYIYIFVVNDINV